MVILEFPDLPPELRALPLRFLLGRDRPNRLKGHFQSLLHCTKAAIAACPVVEPGRQLAIVAR
jgi:hypothetical protein